MKNDYIVKKTYLSFVVVSILTSLTAIVGMLIDNIIVGQTLGSDALGAMGIVGPVSLIFSAVGNISASGGGAKAARALGRGEKEKFCEIFTTNVIFVVVTGLILTAAGLCFTPQIAKLLGAKGSLLEPATRYLYGYFPGAVPTIMVSAMMSFVRIDGSPKLPIFCIGVMSFANIVLDILMVKVFHQGMFGMALATTISYGIALLVALSHFFKKESTLRLVKPKKLFSEMFSSIVTGFATAISRICETLKVLLLNNMLVVYVSVIAVTALNVRTQAFNFLGAVVIGIGQAITPTVGMFYGEEDRTAIKDTLKTTIRIGMTIVLCLSILVFALSGVFPKLMGVKDADTINMAKMALRFFAVSIPVYLFNTILVNYYQCTKKVGMATMICVLQSFVYTVSFAFGLVRVFGANGVWCAFLVGELATTITTFIVIFIRNKKISLRLTDIMLLDEKFGGDPKDRLEISIGNNMEEVIMISTGIHKFFENREIDEKNMNTIALVVEEMAGNVVKHAFKPGEKRWLDFTIIDKPEMVILRIRDNGDAFDPLAHMSSQPKGEEYGIKLIHALADVFEYRRSMGLNNLIIKLNKT